MRQTTMVKVIRINRGDDHMTKEQAQQVLDEMQGLRPEQLKGESKKLFEAIMLIADERDKIKQEYDRDAHILQNQLDLANAENVKKDKQIERYQNMLTTNDMLHIKESQEKDKVIDLMLDEITNNIINTCPFEDYNYYLDCENKCNDDYKECWKQYFENRAKELLNK